MPSIDKNNEHITVDLTQFKLSVHVPGAMDLSLHFDSPSRRFYLTVIALVVTEMKKLGRVTSIPLEPHAHLLALFNSTIGDGAGSSEKELLLPRIYRKWKDALPDLEHAPLFRVVGRRKEHADAIGKTYRFTDEEIDSWANLFEYRGSHEQVRLRFSIDRLGIPLENVRITWGENPPLSDQRAWDQFLAGLRNADHARPRPQREGLGRHRAVAAFVVCLIAAVIAVGIWQLFYHRTTTVSGTQPAVASIPAPFDEPSVAVLPFTNLTGDPKQEFLCDGMTEEIIAGLCRTPRLCVIAFGSTSTYKGKPVVLEEIARELGVRYVLQGGIQRSGNVVRITSQLVDTSTGRHLWAERYDRELKEIFQLQDEITLNVLRSLLYRLTDQEQTLISIRDTDNLDAYLKFLEARTCYNRVAVQDNLMARKLAEEAIRLDPRFSMAYCQLAVTHYMEVWYQSTQSPRDSLTKAAQLAQKAISLNESNGMAHAVLGRVYSLQRKYDEAVREAERAIALMPNSAGVHLLAGQTLQHASKYDDALVAIKKALSLNPLARQSCPYIYLGHAYRMLGRHTEAIDAYQKAVQITPDAVFVHLGMTASYVLSGRDAEARAAAKEVVRIRPDFSVDRYAETLPYKNKDDLEQFIDALRRAGFK